MINKNEDLDLQSSFKINQLHKMNILFISHKNRKRIELRNVSREHPLTQPNLFAKPNSNLKLILAFFFYS